MTNHKEILRLKSLGLSNAEVASGKCRFVSRCCTAK